MASTTSTSLTEIVQSEVIQSQLIATAYENVVVAQFARFADNAAGRGKSPTASFPQFLTDSVSVLTVEGTTTFTSNELETTEMTAITAGVVGLMRRVTDYALETNILGPDELEQYIVKDGGMSCAVNLDNDLCALFASFTASAGSTGVDFSVATFLQMIGNVDASLGRGRKVSVLDNQALNDFRVDLATTGAALFTQPGIQSIVGNLAGNDGYAGQAFGVDVYWTNQTDTANTGADVVSWMGIHGGESPEFASLGVNEIWAPRVKALPGMEDATEIFQITHSYGVGRTSEYASKSISDA